MGYIKKEVEETNEEGDRKRSVPELHGRAQLEQIGDSRPGKKSAREDRRGSVNDMYTQTGRTGAGGRKEGKTPRKTKP